MREWHQLRLCRRFFVEVWGLSHEELGYLMPLLQQINGYGPLSKDEMGILYDAKLWKGVESLFTEDSDGRFSTHLIETYQPNMRQVREAEANAGKRLESESAVWAALDKGARYKTRRELDVSAEEWLKLRKKVIDRDGRVCVYCDLPAKPLHIDHVIPVSDGGLSIMDNLVVACGECNLKKHAKSPSEWKPERA